MQENKITVETIINAPIEKVWTYFTEPEHVMQWNNASPDWHTPRAANDLRTGGTFSYRMEAKDGSTGFDFGGTYDEVHMHERIAYSFGDRKAIATFESRGDGTTKVSETFDPEDVNAIEMQRSGWQAILDNFKRHVETA